MLILDAEKRNYEHGRQQSFTSRNREDQSPIYHRARSSCSIGGLNSNGQNNPPGNSNTSTAK